MTCYCDHDEDSHRDGRGACNDPGCDCESYDKRPDEEDEPGRWFDTSQWKK